MTTGKRLKTKIGMTVLGNEEEAVRDLFDQVNQQDMEAVIFFCSTRYDMDKLGNALANAFPCVLIGCTTSGEISSKGYQEGGMVGVSLSSPELKLHPHFIYPLKTFGLTEAHDLADATRKRAAFSNKIEKEKTFGFLLIDGMSVMEEQIIATLYGQFEGVPIVGGSAGDDLKFATTKVYWDGKFVSDAAVFTIFETTLPFYTFKTQHIRPTDKKLVITDADPSKRIVTEINAESAARAYADILGLRTTDLNPAVFSKYPVMMKVGDNWYVRSIQKANEDGSLSFFCAIDVGLVLTIGEGKDLIGDFKDELNRMRQRVPDADLIIGCDCILRRLEILEKGLTEEMNALLNNLNFVGFSTYGEQFGSVHVNQTLTGVAIGGR